MTPERWHQVQEVFEAALAEAPGQRGRLLDEACVDDQALREEVDALLASHEDPHVVGRFEDAWMTTLVGRLPDQPVEGLRLGPYEVIREIATGGMGAVYLAERADEQFQQRVALKIVRSGLDSEVLRRRFLHERQILARLTHPNIAHLYDGGVSVEGRPYFAMEYVEGVPIDQYSDERRLDVAGRLALFTTVCRAVQYAHQNLVVHRDLKPSNILVTEAGQVKLLDFGIAKLLEAEAVPVTRTGMRVMTPDYASPEQVRGEPVTTASDVYALGVVLYELLTGHRPYRVNHLSPGEVERVVCEQEPERPSAAVRRVEDVPGAGETIRAITLESVSEARNTQVDKLWRQLSGDLDTVVLKALQKDPTRRYASVEHLLEDVQRHLEGLPVRARPDTLSYRVSKFVRRHRAVVAVSVLAWVALLIGIAGTMWQAQVAGAERDRARLGEAEARQVSSFLIDLFKVADPGEARGDTITAWTLLDRGAAAIEQELAGQPEMQATMMNVMGQVYESLGLYDKARSLSEQALAMRRELYGAEHVEVAQSLNNLATVLHRKGDYEAAEPLLREALAMRRELLGEAHPNLAATMNNLALLLHRKGDYEAAEPLLREGLALDRKRLGEAHPNLAATMNNLALLLREKGDYEAAEPLYREALAMRRKMLGAVHPLVAQSLNNLAVLLRSKGDYDAAEPLYREALAMARTLLGEDHPGVVTTMNNLAGLLRQKGDYAAAERLLGEALAKARKVFGEDHPGEAIILNNLAGLLHDKGDHAAAEPRYRTALDLFRHTLPEGHLRIAGSLVGLGRLFVEQDRFAAAEPLLEEAIRIRTEKLEDADERTAEAKLWLGACLTGLQRYEEAEPLLLESYPVLKDERSDQKEHARLALQRLVDLYEAWSKPSEAARYRALLAGEQAS